MPCSRAPDLEPGLYETDGTRRGRDAGATTARLPVHPQAAGLTVGGELAEDAKRRRGVEPRLSRRSPEPPGEA